MAPKIFLAILTPLPIGGDALYAVYHAHPDYEITALVRNSDKGASVAAEYAKIRLVYGTLDDSALLEEESARADIIIHTADSSDNLTAAKAIAKGLAAGHTAENPGYWLHTSGTGILCWKDMDTKTDGEAPSQKPYDDLDHVSDLTSLPDTAWHREIDKLVLSAGSDAVKTAIVCPPTIYGPGRGPENKKSQQVYTLARVTLEKGQAPVRGKGLTEWDNVNIHDLSDLFVLLVDAAVSKNTDLDAEIWGQKGYFLAENGHHVWGEVSKWVAEAAYDQGYIKTKELMPMSKDDKEGLTWGLNSKGFSKRARKFLGWSPKGKSLKDLIPEIVDGEAKTLGLKVGHAAKASGATA